jgi:hypothetical protein
MRGRWRRDCNRSTCLGVVCRSGWRGRGFNLACRRVKDFDVPSHRIQVNARYKKQLRGKAKEQYKSLLTGLQTVGQVKGWKVQQIVFVGGTCGSIHVEHEWIRWDRGNCKGREHVQWDKYA